MPAYSKMIEIHELYIQKLRKRMKRFLGPLKGKSGGAGIADGLCDVVGALPAGIVRQILSECDFKDLYRCSLVAKAWRNAVADEDVWMAVVRRSSLCRGLLIDAQRLNLSYELRKLDWKEYARLVFRARTSVTCRLCRRYYCAVVDTRGRVLVWGAAPENENCRLSHDGLYPVPIDSFVFGNGRVVQVSVGGLHFLALTELGRVFSWGRSRFGRLGLGPMGDSVVSAPREVVALCERRIVWVSAGEMHSAVVSDIGELLTFGSGADGKTGLGTTDDVSVPTLVSQLSPVSQSGRIVRVDTGGFHTLALTFGGDVYSFGWGAFGQLGLGDTASQNIPFRVIHLDGTKVCEVSAGMMHSAVVDEQGRVFTFGFGERYQLGHGDKTTVFLPTLVSQLSEIRIVSVSCGDNHTMAVSRTGDLFVWGSGYKGRLGLGFPRDEDERVERRPRVHSPERKRSAGGRLARSLTRGFEKLVRIDGDTQKRGRRRIRSGPMGSESSEYSSDPMSREASQSPREACTCGLAHRAQPRDTGYSSDGAQFWESRRLQEKDQPLPALVKRFRGVRQTIPRIAACSAGGTISLMVSEDGRCFTCGEGNRGQHGSGRICPCFRPRPVKTLAGNQCAAAQAATLQHGD